MSTAEKPREANDNIDLKKLTGVTEGGEVN
jgi:hypothetical protein